MSQQTSEDIVTWLSDVFVKSGKTEAVIAVSGGIDSAVSCTLLCQAIDADHVYPIFLPYQDQSTKDARQLAQWCQIPQTQWREYNIAATVETIAEEVIKEPSTSPDAIRLGNIMARVRMIYVFDVAKELEALVCGTENKSEKYLGYFTRFGDGASDIEPIQELYKTQVREVARELGVPDIFLDKAPSAGLWHGQTDETEFGFSYTDADAVLTVLVDEQPDLLNQLVKNEQPVEWIAGQVANGVGEGIRLDTIHLVLQRVKNQWFKQEVPYQFEIKDQRLETSDKM